ncbi:MAG: phage tail protein [Bacteroidota bacterium]
MANTQSGYIPPVGFYFSVHILEEGAGPSSATDASFQEVSGISVAMETEQIEEGGDNRFTHRIPGRTKYDNLVLKRGLLIRSSGLVKWCEKMLNGNLSQQIVPKTIKVSLLDANTDGKGALMTWVFVSAYPVKWEISSFDATKDELVVDSITFTYSYFDRQESPSAAHFPTS